MALRSARNCSAAGLGQRGPQVGPKVGQVLATLKVPILKEQEEEEEEEALPAPPSPSRTPHLPTLCLQSTYQTVFLH